MKLLCATTMADPQKRKHRVLLVGRDAYQINAISEHLSAPVVECEAVMNVETAKNVLSCRSMDVMVIDSALGSPDKKTMQQLFEGLRPRSGKIKIVVYNGVCNRTLQRQIRRLGADGYLSSKNNMKSVAGSVKRILGL